LAGGPPTRDRIDVAAALAAERDVDPVGDLHASADFKRHLVGVLTRRALTTASARASEAA
jgi:carbon-monoxide dehydrogenase medium subunit